MTSCSQHVTIIVLIIFAYREICRAISELSSRSDQINRATAIQLPYLQNRDDSTGAECLSLSLNGRIDTIISKHQQIFILMPPKAAGTTVKAFTKLCTKRNDTQRIMRSRERRRELLTSSLEVPPIISAHVLGDQPFVETVQHSSSGTLLIYIHRDETDRLVSAINEVLFNRLCNWGQYHKHNEILIKNKTHCILHESLVVDHIIQTRQGEIGHDILTCKAYNALEQNDPNIIFIHYKQVNKLQKLLAKTHCPELLDGSPVESNTAEDKENQEMKVYLKSENNMVPLVDWLNAKKNFLEWSLLLRRNADCQAKTKHMQTELFNCAHETLMVTDGSTWYKQL